MQPAGAPSQSNWNPLHAAADLAESDMVAQLLNTYSLASECDHEPSFGFTSIFWSDQDVESSYSSGGNGAVGSILDYWPQGCSGMASDGAFLPPPDLGSYQLSDPNAVGAMNDSSVMMDVCMVGEQSNHSSLLLHPEHLLEAPVSMNEEARSEGFGGSHANASGPVSIPSRRCSPKRKFLQVTESDRVVDVHDKGTDSSTVSPKKKLGAAADVQAQNNGKSVQSKKAKRAAGNGDAEESSAAINGQASSSYSSEEDSSASQEMTGGGESSGLKSSATPNSNGKTRAGRGSATDPQSLYARKRRERINERLRILQNLVPNGTKVDISTMLEEAVQYVKFLQLQIKLLSSDDLWMYAPIAYNGMNIGLDLKISPPQ